MADSFKPKKLYKMKMGLHRFTYYTTQVEDLLLKAGREDNPALWLFTIGARTPFFMLEALAKLYAGLHNSKKFDKLKEHFKLVEDGLGQIDYYDTLSKAFDPLEKVQGEYKQYIAAKMYKSAEALNVILKDEGWISEDNRRIRKISGKLREADWMEPENETEGMSKFYLKSISKIAGFIHETGFSFDNVEEDVHELRRKLRWLSIYPQALQGAVQYDKNSTEEAHLKKYLTEEIINSPFNKFAAKGNNKSILLLRRNYFLALSWMIAELGKLKDEGLLLTGLCEAITDRKSCTKEDALLEAYKFLGKKQRKLDEILDDAEVITERFFKEKNLNYLISGTA